MARIISIVNQKGGTGKSACTANLAVGLAQKNMKVLIVDADPQSDVSAGFGYRDCDDSNETLTALMDAVMKDTRNRKVHKEHDKARWAYRKAQKNLQTERTEANLTTFKEARKVMLSTPHLDEMDESYKRLQYNRYADYTEVSA